MNIYYDETDPLVAFGVSKLIEALRGKEIYVLERRFQNLPSEINIESIVIKTGENISAEGFTINRSGVVIYILGGDSKGTMYGALELAEQIQLYGLDKVEEKSKKPFLNMRGIKFNLPWEPYDTGEPFTKNEQICWDLGFWRNYIDMLAMNRYNCLTLWSRHPFHLMFRLAKYPETTYLSDAELERNTRFFRELFGYAKRRGIDTYIITWCVDIIPQVIKGLGLPPHFADPKTSHRVRQESEPIKDYFRECVKTLLNAYPELTGIGTSGSEEMVGDAWVRERWVVDTYLEGIKQSGRVVPFIHRTNQQAGKPIKDLFVDQYEGQTYISWKYSNAHMYSHPKPIFDQLWGAWEGVDMDEVKITYTVRNDDILTLRWGDPEYTREYVVNMKKPYVHGFYWGADGYLWGIDFQHADTGHKRWKYDFERRWYEFALWGRTSYDQDISEDIWKERFRWRYGKAGDALFEGMKAGSKIIPAVNKLLWINYDFQWYPEGCLSRFGYKTIKDFVDGSPMPGSGVISIREYVQALAEGKTPQAFRKGLSERGKQGRLSPLDDITPQNIIDEIEKASRRAMETCQNLRDKLSHEEIDGDLECVLMDIEAWSYLGLYYREKFNAAVCLAKFIYMNDQDQKEQAVESMEKAREYWVELGNIWSQHYKPYFMARTKMTFGWSLYLEQIQQDIEIAKGYKRSE
jgi:hypothetical protein